jgi:hypothetical protein
MTMACLGIEGDDCHGLWCRAWHARQADMLLHGLGQLLGTSNGLQDGHSLRGRAGCATGTGCWVLWCSGKNISQPRYE